jgi:serine/threonine protein kinase
LAGREFGAYRLISLIGHGGMSEVYRAEHKLMQRLVAIKLIRVTEDQADSRHAAERFRQEAKMLSSLNHPNIVDVHDFGKEGEFIYMVMELLPGSSLRQLLQTSVVFDFKTSVAVFIQVCEALKHAHEHNVIHRDLKPGNVMITPDGKVKLLDFGVAKLLRPDAFDYQLDTEDDFLLGSPPYLSPEQCQGLPLDPRSDIYSLGCLMYETLTGHLPVIGHNSMETVQKHLRYTPRRFKNVAPDLNIPAGAELVTIKCLQKQPQARYQTVDELLKDLQALASDKNFADLNVDKSILNKPESAHSDWFAAPGALSPHVIEQLDEIKAFAYSSFDRIDTNGDGFISEQELQDAIMDEKTPWRQKSYLNFLLRRLGDVQSSYDEEWAPDHAGISRADIQEYFNLVKRDLESIAAKEP